MIEKMPNHSPIQFDTITWIIGAFFVIYYSEIILAVQVDNAIGGTFFHLAVLSSVMVGLIFLYLIAWCNVYKGMDSEKWEKEVPYAIPIATGLGVASGVFWNIALWPVYGFWTPPMLFVIFMGFIMSVSILPPWNTEDSAISAKKTQNKSNQKLH